MSSFASPLSPLPYKRDPKLSLRALALFSFSAAGIDAGELELAMDSPPRTHILQSNSTNLFPKPPRSSGA